MTDELKDKVRKIYIETLNIEPQPYTLKFYCNKIKRKETTIEKLHLLLNPINSPQYEQKKYHFDINFFEKTVYSQNGEDGIIEFIFSEIKTTNKFFVEFGVGDGTICNTRYLMEKKGWSGLMMNDEENSLPHIKKEFITAENINQLFQKYNVPKYFDLLSIDIDYNDFWIWKAIDDYYPRVVVIEYNSSIPPNESKVVPYDPLAKWDRNNKTNFFGASILALQKLGKEKGYTLVGCDSKGINAFFIKNDIVKEKLIESDVKKLYKPPRYGVRVNGVLIGHPPTNKPMLEI